MTQTLVQQLKNPLLEIAKYQIAKYDLKSIELDKSFVLPEYVIFRHRQNGKLVKWFNNDRQVEAVNEPETPVEVFNKFVQIMDMRRCVNTMPLDYYQNEANRIIQDTPFVASTEAGHVVTDKERFKKLLETLSEELEKELGSGLIFENPHEDGEFSYVLGNGIHAYFGISTDNARFTLV